MDEFERLKRSLAVGGGVLLALVLITEVYIWINLWPMTIGFGTAALWSLPQLALWILLVPLIASIARRLPIEAGPGPIRVLAHLAASVVLSVGALALLDLSDRLLHWTLLMGAPDSLISNLQYTIIHLHLGVGIYWVILGGVHATRYYTRFREGELRAAQLETQLAQAQLQALRAQLHPHFLFNTLNSIAVLMHRDVPGAEQMLHRLSGLLRITLEHAATQEVPLHEELEFLRLYLDIEQTRFRDRLTVTVEVAPEALDVPVPYMLLQPLVENALQHGIGQRTEGGHLEIHATATNGMLSIVVRDDGPGLSADGAGREGIGLSNTRGRLERLYGAHYRFTLRNLEAGGVEVDLGIPCVPVAASAEGAGRS
jgi:signal transduction histidine kinase